jgi:hypothetical protein
MGHYISAFCPTHGDVDCDDGNAFCEDCYEVNPKGALTALESQLAEARAKCEELEGKIREWANVIEHEDMDDDAADGVVVRDVILKEMRDAHR